MSLNASFSLQGADITVQYGTGLPASRASWKPYAGPLPFGPGTHQVHARAVAPGFIDSEVVSTSLTVLGAVDPVPSGPAGISFTLLPEQSRFFTFQVRRSARRCQRAADGVRVGGRGDPRCVSRSDA